MKADTLKAQIDHMPKNDVVIKKLDADTLVIAIDLITQAFQEAGVTQASPELERALEELSVSSGWLPSEVRAELMRRTTAANNAVREYMRTKGN